MVRIAGCLKTEACLESELGTSVGDYYIFILYKIWVQCQHVSDLLNLFNGYIIEETLFEIFLLKKKSGFIAVYEWKIKEPNFVFHPNMMCSVPLPRALLLFI